MNLNDYIALSSKRPNRAVLQGLGASEELIEYLMETPNNTNLNVIDSIEGTVPMGNKLVLDSMEVTIDGRSETMVACTNCCELFNDVWERASKGEIQPVANGYLGETAEFKFENRPLIAVETQGMKVLGDEENELIIIDGSAAYGSCIVAYYFPNTGHLEITW